MKTNTKYSIKLFFIYIFLLSVTPNMGLDFIYVLSRGAPVSVYEAAMDVSEETPIIYYSSPTPATEVICSNTHRFGPNCD